MKTVTVILIAMGLASPPVPVPAAPDVLRQAELLHLLKHDCGSCHGMTRKGGLGPALLPENLQERSRELLVLTVLDGRAGTPMPPWRGQLSEEEANWLVEVLLRGEDL